MTPEEQERQAKLITLVQSYESTNEESKKEALFNEINEISECSRFNLEQYWEACSIEEFCIGLAVIPATSDEMTREKAISIIQKLHDGDDTDEPDYLLSKYENAIELFFNCGSYSLSDAIFYSEKSVEEIVKDMEESGPTTQSGPILL